MIRSMTGFARRERQFPWGLLAWELKTVNHRFLEMGCRLPEEFRVARSGVPADHRRRRRRGKVECSLHFRPAVAAGALEVDAELLGSLDPAGAANRRAGGRRGADRRPGTAALAGRDPRRHPRPRAA